MGQSEKKLPWTHLHGGCAFLHVGLCQLLQHDVRGRVSEEQVVLLVLGGAELPAQQRKVLLRRADQADGAQVV